MEVLSGSRRVRVSRDGCAAILELPDGEVRVIERAGVIMGGEIGALVDGGFQKFFQTPSGKRKPALASDLQALHDFQEDLGSAGPDQPLQRIAGHRLHVLSVRPREGPRPGRAQAGLGIGLYRLPPIRSSK